VRVTFLGVRGSIPVSDAAMLGVGGHTSAIAVAHDGVPPSLLLDAGTGLRQYGRHIGAAPFRGTIALGHLHWDHIIGLPFFQEADHPDARICVRVPEQGEDAESLMARMMSPPVFPIAPQALRGNWTYASYDEGWQEWEGFTVLAREIPHKGGRTMGLRLTDGSTTLAYLSDHAPQDLGPGRDGTGELHEAALALADRADLLIHDAQYTRAELPARGHYGHAAAEYAALLAEAADVRSLMLFHHDPDRTDLDVYGVADSIRRNVSTAVDVACEGVSVDLAAVVRQVVGE
jgi:ribonuclease BN (tRNA processing enzyme)